MKRHTEVEHRIQYRDINARNDRPATTAATKPDWGMLPEVDRSLKRIDLLPADHLVDTGYVSAESIVSSQRDFNRRRMAQSQTLKPATTNRT